LQLPVTVFVGFAPLVADTVPLALQETIGVPGAFAEALARLIVRLTVLPVITYVPENAAEASPNGDVTAQLPVRLLLAIWLVQVALPRSELHETVTPVEIVPVTLQEAGTVTDGLAGVVLALAAAGSASAATARMAAGAIAFNDFMCISL
jgi:hypothetical protein